MNFIFNNKLAIFLIFMMFYCLFNYTISGFQEGYDVKIDKTTGEAKQKTKEDIIAQTDMQNKLRKAAFKKQAELSKPGGAMDQAEEKQKIQQAAEKELSHDRKAALSAKSATQQKKATEGSALARMVESIDGETGQEMEKAALKNLSESVDKTTKTEDENKSAEAPDANTGERGKALGTGGGMAEEARKAAANLSTIAMKDTMKAVAQAQNAAVENLTSSVAQSKNLDKKLSGVAKSYGLASQGDEADEADAVVGAENTSGFVRNKCQKWSPKELIKQRDRVANRFGCQERCKYLYDDQTGFLCDSGNCICKINRDKKELLKLPGSAMAKVKKKEKAKRRKKKKKKKDDPVTEAFTSKYVYRIHGKCDTTELDRGSA